MFKSLHVCGKTIPKSICELEFGGSNITKSTEVQTTNKLFKIVLICLKLGYLYSFLNNSQTLLFLKDVTKYDYCAGRKLIITSKYSNDSITIRCGKYVIEAR